MTLFTRAKDLGIQTEFVDGQGHRHVTDPVALKIILDALPARVPYRFLDEAVVIRSGRPSRTDATSTFAVTNSLPAQDTRCKNSIEAPRSSEISVSTSRRSSITAGARYSIRRRLTTSST